MYIWYLMTRRFVSGTSKDSIRGVNKIFLFYPSSIWPQPQCILDKEKLAFSFRQRLLVSRSSFCRSLTTNLMNANYSKYWKFYQRYHLAQYQKYFISQTHSFDIERRLFTWVYGLMTFLGAIYDFQSICRYYFGSVALFFIQGKTCMRLFQRYSKSLYCS